MIGAIVEVGAQLVGALFPLIQRAVTARTEEQAAILVRLQQWTDELKQASADLDKILAEHDTAADKALGG